MAAAYVLPLKTGYYPPVANRINARRRAPGGRPHLSASTLPAKVNRLSRSLTDFGCIVEIFERHNASFVSIAQQFNTTTSMGRLTLNILLSFAQFEREVIGDTHEAVMQAKPNSGHLAIPELVRLGKVAAVITQNVDGLNQASGIPRQQVIELHGNTTYAHCLSCGKEYDPEPSRETFLADQTLPECAGCGGLVKTATISFGPQDEMRRATTEAMVCDLFLAIGSSLKVYPAAGLPALAKQAGAGLVIINREQTDLDHLADLVINKEIGPTLEATLNW